MRKIIFVLAVFLFQNAFSQTVEYVNSIPILDVKTPVLEEFRERNNFEYSMMRSNNAIWSDDFSDASTWIMTNTGYEDVDWTIETDENAMPNAGSAVFPFLSNSLNNGYALINSDAAPGNVDGDGAIIAQLTTANPIDLSNNNDVLLRFNHNYRWWHEDRGVRVSGDNGVTWTDFPITSDYGGVFPSGYPNDQASANPEFEIINISSVAGGQSEVLIQFYYNDNDFWAWYWAIDDVEIITLAVDDLVLETAWLSNTYGVEYARVPESQFPDTLIMGASVLNFGANDQTNINVDITVSDASGTQVLNGSLSSASIESDSTEYFETHQLNPSLGQGLYTLSAVASSDGDSENGSTFDNNSYTRNFEVTSNVFSIDGIGVYEEETSSITALGTNYGDGIIILAQYLIEEETEIVGLEIALGSNTDVGGAIYPFIMTADAVLSDNVDISNRVVEGEDLVEIEQWNIDNNIIFTELPTTVLQPGVYYACAELYNGSNFDDHVYILDDETVDQPVMSSLIFHIENWSLYTNGNASAIRLALGDYTPVADYGCLDPEYLEYNSQALNSDPSLCQTLVVVGCMDETAENYNSQANIDDGSCVFDSPQENCNDAIYISLQEGWNLIGFACSEEINAVDAFSSIVNELLIVKENSGQAYLPEWDFNGIGNLERGYGYQLKITQAVPNFNVCE